MFMKADQYNSITESKTLGCCFFCFWFFFVFFIQNTSHCSLLTHTNYTKHIFHTGPTHETHKTHERFFSENIRNIYTQQENFPQTHAKIILITDLRHKLSDKTDHFTRNSNFLLYNSALYSSITTLVLNFT